jgi:phage shock protein A
MSSQPEVTLLFRTIEGQQQRLAEMLRALDALIGHVEKLERRVGQLEREAASAKLEHQPDPFDDVPGG